MQIRIPISREIMAGQLAGKLDHCVESVAQQLAVAKQRRGFVEVARRNLEVLDNTFGSRFLHYVGAFSNDSLLLAVARMFDTSRDARSVRAGVRIMKSAAESKCLPPRTHFVGELWTRYRLSAGLADDSKHDTVDDEQLALLIASVLEDQLSKLAPIAFTVKKIRDKHLAHDDFREADKQGLEAEELDKAFAVALAFLDLTRAFRNHGFVTDGEYTLHGWDGPVEGFGALLRRLGRQRDHDLPPGYEIKHVGKRLFHLHRSGEERWLYIAHDRDQAALAAWQHVCGVLDSTHDGAGRHARLTDEELRVEGAKRKATLDDLFNSADNYFSAAEDCPHCQGTGWQERGNPTPDRCQLCRGRGRVPVHVSARWAVEDAEEPGP